MEAAGLAVGVVSLGLDLATRLQTYIEAVKDAGDRLNEITADVSATASIVRQLAALLDADKIASAHQQIDAPSVSSHNSDAATLRVPSPSLIRQPVFSAKGIQDIEALLRRCEQAYRIIVNILVSATSESFSRTQKVLANTGLGDLTAARLARLTSRAKWPWLEPRIKACQKQLKSIKVDLLLSLNIASLAKHRNSPSQDAVVSDEEDAALRSFAERLITQRAKSRNRPSSPTLKPSTATILEGSSANPGSVTPSILGNVPRNASELPPVPEPVFASPLGSQPRKTSEVYQFGSGAPMATNFISVPSVPSLPGPVASPRPSMRNLKVRRDWDGPLSRKVNMTSTEGTNTSIGSTQSSVYIGSRETPAAEDRPDTAGELPTHPLVDVPGHGDGISMGSLIHRDNDDIGNFEGWFLCRNNSSAGLFKIPVRGPALRDTLRSCTKRGPVSTLDQFLSLTPDLREAVLQIIGYSRQKDDRVKTLVALFTRSTHPELPRNAQVLAVISPDDLAREVVHLEDLVGETWPVPFYALKTALMNSKSMSDLEAEVLRRCNGTSLLGNVRLFAEVKSDFAFAAVSSTPVSFSTLRDILQPGLKIRLKQTRPQPPLPSPASPGFFGSSLPTGPPVASKYLFGAKSGDEAHPRSQAQTQNTHPTREHPSLFSSVSGPLPIWTESGPVLAPSTQSDSGGAGIFGRKRPLTSTAKASFQTHRRAPSETVDSDTSGAESPLCFDMSEMDLLGRRSLDSENDVQRELFGDEIAERGAEPQAVEVQDLLYRWTNVGMKGHTGQ